MLIVTLLCPPLCHMATSQWFKHDLEIVSCKHWAKSHDVLNILFFRFHESQYPIKKKETAWTSPVPKAKLPMCWWLFCYKAPTLSSCILSEEHHSCLCFSLPYVACLFWHHWPLLIPFSIFTLILSRQWWSGPCSLGTTSGNSSVWNSTNTEQWFWGMVVDNKWKKKHSVVQSLRILKTHHHLWNQLQVWEPPDCHFWFQLQVWKSPSPSSGSAVP